MRTFLAILTAAAALATAAPALANPTPPPKPRGTSLPSPLAPHIRITAPARHRTRHATIVVHGRAFGAPPVRGVRINGHRIALSANGRFRARVRLHHGRNRITVAAINAINVQTGHRLTITRV